MATRIPKSLMELPTKATATEASAAEAAHDANSQRKRPEAGQYLLQVDRQTKGSYTTLETAMKAGTAIKTAHPVVQVGVYNTVDCVNTLVEPAVG